MKQPAKLVAVVVDDNALILMAACGILEDAGFSCLDASSGEEAWDHVAAHDGRIALLFSDIQMPGGMDGLSLAHRVHQAYPEVEIVLASGHVRPVPRRHATALHLHPQALHRADRHQSSGAQIRGRARGRGGAFHALTAGRSASSTAPLRPPRARLSSFA